MPRSSDRRRIEIELEARLSDLRSAQAELAEAQQETQTLKGRIEELEAALDAQGRAARFETELATVAAQMKDMERAHNLEARVGELQERARTGEVHEGLTPVEARLVEVETALLKADERAQDAEHKEREAQDRVEAATADLAAAGAGSGVAEPSEATVALRGEVERATARIQELEMQLQQAAARPEADAVSDRSPGDAEGPGELAAVVAELEERLVQTEARARRAYGAAEAAEAALRFAKGRGEVVTSDPQLESEVERLRNQIPELMKRVEEAEEARRRAEADADTLREAAGRDAGNLGGDGEISNGSVTQEDVSPGVAAWR